MNRSPGSNPGSSARQKARLRAKKKSTENRAFSIFVCPDEYLMHRDKITPNSQNSSIKNHYMYCKININTASIEELKTLTGIGQSTAEKIINYRNEVSKFEKIEDIKNVSGIGDSKFNSIKDKIVVK